MVHVIVTFKKISPHKTYLFNNLIFGHFHNELEDKLTTNHHLCLNQDSKIWFVWNRVDHIFNIKNIIFSIFFGLMALNLHFNSIW